MALKWIGSFAALAASAGLALAQAPTPIDSAAPETSDVKPAACVTIGPTVEPRAVSAPCASGCAAGSPCASRLFNEPGCSDDYRLSAYVDYLLWFYKRDHAPTLVGAIPPSLERVNPLPAGSIFPLFGGPRNTLDADGQSGVRFGVKGWLDEQERLGLDVDYFQLEHGSQHAAFQSAPNGLPIIGPVFNDPVTGRDTILLLSEPGISTANLAVSTQTRFWGAEADFRRRIPAVFSDRLEFLAGFRTVQFDQNLNVSGSAADLPGVNATFPGNPNTQSFSYQDSFSVHDRFYGPQIGLESDTVYKIFFLNVKAKFAAGEMNESVRINGSTTFLAPNVFTVPGGVLAQRTNIGNHSRTLFTVLPELTVNTGVQLGDHFRVLVGYNLIYVNQLQRVGTAVGGVDGSQIPILHATPNPNATQPAFTFDEGRFWAQGLNAGMEFRY